MVILEHTASELQEFKGDNRKDTLWRSLPRPWINAIARKFPDTPLGKLRIDTPSLLPSWMSQEFETYQVRAYRRTRPLELGNARGLIGRSAGPSCAVPIDHTRST
jgi:hypothetical protein